MTGRAASGILAVLAALTVTAGLALVLAAGGAAAGPAPRGDTAAANPPASSLTWHAPVPVDGTGVGSVVAVSCTGPSYCAAFDNAGYQAAWRGSAWTAPASIVPGTSNYGVVSATCAMPGFCVAVGTAIWVRAGGTVTASQPGGRHVWAAVSCASPAFCVAGDYFGNVTFYNGRSWSAPVSVAEYGLTGISCVSTVSCVALDLGGSVLTWNGTAWKTTDADLMPYGDAAGVSCASATFCMALDLHGGVYKFNGSAWAGPGSTGLGHSPADVSCTSRTFCVAVATTGDAAEYNGSRWSSWSHRILSGPGSVFVSCSPGSRDCAAIGETGYADTLRSGTWTGQVSVDASGGELDAVACPATGFCVAVDVSGDVVMYRGGRWGAPVRLLPGGWFTSVSCPSARFCLTAGATASGALRMWRYNGTRWTPAAVPAAPANPVTASGGSVSCVSAAFCVWAAHAHGLISVFNGKTWSKPADVDKVVTWTDVSCATRSFCVAGDLSGSVAEYNGKGWSRLRELIRDVVTADIPSLSCPSPRFCEAALEGGVATFTGRTWTHAPRSDDPALGAVSCTQGDFCAGIGAGPSGEPGAYTLNGRQWSRPVPVFTAWDLESTVAISCATPAFCMATDAHGLAMEGTRD
jgi:hypothetical protein